MPNFAFVPDSASYPQVGENRVISDILDDLTDYVGGGDRPAAQDRARRSLNAAVRMFDSVAWRFLRQQQTITLANNITDYSLNAFFRSPRAALLLDSNGDAAGPLEWVRYEDWARYEADESTPAISPEAYTARNSFATGLLTMIPPLGTINTQYPQVRLDYHTRIVIPTSDGSTLNVPILIEEAIVQEAVAIIVAKTRSFTEAQIARAVARDLRQSCEREWRDFPDSAVGNQA